jgi:hypothetical protein
MTKSVVEIRACIQDTGLRCLTLWRGHMISYNRALYTEMLYDSDIVNDIAKFML